MNTCGIFILILYIAKTTSMSTSTKTTSMSTSTKTTSRSTSTKNNNPLIDTLIVKLKQATWDDNEKTCRGMTLEMLYGVKNKTLWAVWVPQTALQIGAITSVILNETAYPVTWDAMQPPVGALYGTRGHFGNYDQCLKAPWSAAQGPVLQYCLVDVETNPSQAYRQLGPYDNVDDYLKATTKYGRPMNRQTFGVCLPSSCRTDSVAKVYHLMHQLSYLTEGNVTVNPRDCQVAEEAEPKTMGFIVFWALIAALTMMVVISTYYCTNVEHRNKSIESITKPFCLKTNMAELTKQSDGEIKVMNGMRFLSAAIVVMMHEYVLRTAVPVANNLDMEQAEKTFLGKVVLHSDIVVDTFVAMSGLLLAKSLLAMRNKNLLLWLVKRYIRLIGPFAILTFFVLYSINHTGDGPIWKRGLSIELDTCKVYWWKNLLMINNDIRTVCIGVSWYVSCDYQLGILGTFIVYLYRRNKKIGLSAFIGTCVLCTAKVAWVTYSKKLPLLPFDNFLIFLDVRNHVLLNDVYFNFESRVASYFLGMAVGYLMTVYKPTKYRNTINKTWSTIIMVLSLIFLNMILCLNYLYNPLTYNPVEVAILVALNRSIWVFGICGIILVSEYGSQNFITDFLSLSIFGPLSKLSYGVYLVHFLIEQRNAFSLRNIAKYDIILSATNSFGIVILSCIASLIIYLLIEAPLITISNDLLKEKKEESNMNGTEAHHIHRNGNSKSKVS